MKICEIVGGTLRVPLLLGCVLEYNVWTTHAEGSCRSASRGVCNFVTPTSYAHGNSVLMRGQQPSKGFIFAKLHVTALFCEGSAVFGVPVFV